MFPEVKSSHRRVGSSGLTLVEMFFALCLIIVLTAVGIPALSSMGSRAEDSRCRENLRTWGHAIGSYAADHDGRINWEHWHSISHDPKKCSPYVPYWTGGTTTSESFDIQLKQRCCPAVEWDAKQDGNAPVSYAMIRPSCVPKVGVTARMKDDRSSDYPLSQITKPARFILMIDATGDGTTIAGPADFHAKVKPLTLEGGNLRHHHTVNALMADYSIRTFAWDEIESGLEQWTTF